MLNTFINLSTQIFEKLIKSKKFYISSKKEKKCVKTGYFEELEKIVTR